MKKVLRFSALVKVTFNFTRYRPIQNIAQYKQLAADWWYWESARYINKGGYLTVQQIGLEFWWTDYTPWLRIRPGDLLAAVEAGKLKPCNSPTQGWCKQYVGKSTEAASTAQIGV